MRRSAGPRVMDAADPEGLAAAAEVLRRGGLVALPTETVYGLACALEPEALDRLRNAKRRSAAKGLALVVETLEQALPIAVIPPAAALLAERFWPGPLTLVLAVRPGVALPRAVTGGSGMVGIRVPDHPVPRRLASALGPLPTTSANLSGEPEALTAGAVVAALGEAVELILDGGPSPGGVPSTVVALSAQGDLRLIRAGAVPYQRIEAAIAVPDRKTAQREAEDRAARAGSMRPSPTPSPVAGPGRQLDRDPSSTGGR
jgi:L-threonylcarbamoyladenylate synthase